MKRSIFASAFVFSTCLVPLAGAGDWPNWRGPLHNGSSDAEMELPVKFSQSDNVKWKVTLPGEGASTPVVWKEAVFLTSADESQDGIVAIRLNRETGETVWAKKFGEGIRQDERSNFAGPSPATDGELVVFFSGSGDLAAFDLDGKELWKRNLQKDYGSFAFQWTFSTSPLLHGGTLYMQVLQRDTAVGDRGFKDKKNESYLLALDPKTGKEKWRHLRPSDAVQESLEAFSTPVPVTHGGREEILVVGGDCITGHEPGTGKELWRWGTWNKEKIGHWRLVPSPVVGDGIVLACAPKGAPVYAIPMGKSGKLMDSELAWVSEGKEVNSDVPTPLFYKGRFYILNDRNKFLSCVEPGTGKVIWSERLEAKVKIEASPTAADGKIYLMSHLGEVFVVQAGDEFKLLHQTQLGESQSTNIRSSVVPAYGNLFIRTDDQLFCIGK
ncbi:MAG: PQQ-binding-like beta-propeller repeat protein [Verrucomicrobiales bacterium]|nr:PQQ-binding-like beta-propeller repeat protein [Verrucomicrobiales bacterium]